MAEEADEDEDDEEEDEEDEDEDEVGSGKLGVVSPLVLPCGVGLLKSFPFVNPSLSLPSSSSLSLSLSLSSWSSSSSSTVSFDIWVIYVKYYYIMFFLTDRMLMITCNML